MYSVYEILRKAKGVSDYAVAKACNFGQSTLTDWKKGRCTPRPDKLQKIAAYFGVTVDYLMTGQDSEKKASSLLDLTDEEQLLLAAFRQLNADGQAEAIKDIRKLLYVPEYKADAPTAQAVEKVAEAI